jgi:glycosyltransferase involved in cell wall biosynthesis
MVQSVKEVNTRGEDRMNALRHGQFIQKKRTLMLVSAGLGLPDTPELLESEQADLTPRANPIRQALSADVLDEAFLKQRVSGYRSRLYTHLPVQVAQIAEGFALRHKYEAIISWAEYLGIPLAGLFKLTNSRPVHVALFSWISKPKKARILRRVHSHIDRIILWSSVQRDYAIEKIGIPPSKISFVRYYVDQRFWRSMGSEDPDMICSSGREMRDYGTLIEALRGLDLPCHIAARFFPGKNDAWISHLNRLGSIPSNITIESKTPVELRQLYDRSRFVVIPLLPTDTDNGVTCILEAMSMGKAVICSRVRGQRDVIQEGKTGLFVPPKDPRALREAIEYLWRNPQLAEQMGRAARAQVEKYHTLDSWVEQVSTIIQEVIRERKGIVRDFVRRESASAFPLREAEEI